MGVKSQVIHPSYVLFSIYFILITSVIYVLLSTFTNFCFIFLAYVFIFLTYRCVVFRLLQIVYFPYPMLFSPSSNHFLFLYTVFPPPLLNTVYDPCLFFVFYFYKLFIFLTYAFLSTIYILRELFGTYFSLIRIGQYTSI